MGRAHDARPCRRTRWCATSAAAQSIWSARTARWSRRARASRSPSPSRACSASRARWPKRSSAHPRCASRARTWRTRRTGGGCSWTRLPPRTRSAGCARAASAGLVPFSNKLAAEEWRSLRLAIKQESVAANIARCLAAFDEPPTALVLAGGGALDDELTAHGRRGARAAFRSWSAGRTSTACTGRGLRWRVDCLLCTRASRQSGDRFGDVAAPQIRIDPVHGGITLVGTGDHVVGVQVGDDAQAVGDRVGVARLMKSLDVARPPPTLGVAGPACLR